MTNVQKQLWKTVKKQDTFDLRNAKKYEIREKCTMKYTVKKDIVIYPELSFQIVGCAFELMKEIGSGHKESVYLFFVLFRFS